MSIKKVISLSVLLYVNVLILGHVVVPHYHHGFGKICFFNIHCEDCEKLQNHEPHKCITDEAYILASKCIKNKCCSYTGCDCAQELQALISNTLNIQKLVDDIPIHFQLNPDIQFFYSNFVAQSLGLRAPPFPFLFN